MGKKFILNNPVILTSEYNVKKFDCGNHILNHYLKKYALVNQNSNISACYVITDENNVIAYYCLTIGSINCVDAPEFLTKDLPKYPIPVLILARLAVDENYQGVGIAKNLLREVIQRSIFLAKDIACVALFVLAKNETAKNFYVKYGFREDFNDPLKLYLPVKDIIESV